MQKLMIHHRILRIDYVKTELKGKAHVNEMQKIRIKGIQNSTKQVG